MSKKHSSLNQVRQQTHPFHFQIHFITKHIYLRLTSIVGFPLGCVAVSHHLGKHEHPIHGYLWTHHLRHRGIGHGCRHRWRGWKAREGRNRGQLRSIQNLGRQSGGYVPKGFAENGCHPDLDLFLRRRIGKNERTSKRTNSWTGVVHLHSCNYFNAMFYVVYDEDVEHTTYTHIISTGRLVEFWIECPRNIAAQERNRNLSLPHLHCLHDTTPCFWAYRICLYIAIDREELV